MSDCCGNVCQSWAVHDVAPAEGFGGIGGEHSSLHYYLSDCFLLTVPVGMDLTWTSDKEVCFTALQDGNVKTGGKHVNERAALDTKVKSECLMTAREAAFGTFPSVDPISKIFQACSILASVTNRFPAVQAEL